MESECLNECHLLVTTIAIAMEEKMMKIINWCAVLLIVLASCAGPAENTANEPIKLGSILILSGEGASWGNAAKNGIDMAVEKINAGGGINGRLLAVDHQDDKSDPK